MWPMHEVNQCHSVSGGQLKNFHVVLPHSIQKQHRDINLLWWLRESHVIPIPSGKCREANFKCLIIFHIIRFHQKAWLGGSRAVFRLLRVGIGADFVWLSSISLPGSIRKQHVNLCRSYRYPWMVCTMDSWLGSPLLSAIAHWMSIPIGSWSEST